MAKGGGRNVLCSKRMQVPYSQVSRWKSNPSSKHLPFQADWRKRVQLKIYLFPPVRGQELATQSRASWLKSVTLQSKRYFAGSQARYLNLKRQQFSNHSRDILKYLKGIFKCLRDNWKYLRSSSRYQLIWVVSWNTRDISLDTWKVSKTFARYPKMFDEYLRVVERYLQLWKTRTTDTRATTQQVSFKSFFNCKLQIKHQYWWKIKQWQKH